MLAIIIFTAFAIVVIFGVLDLKKSKLSDQHKVMILTAVGVLLSVSLLISALKETRHLTFSLLKTNMNEVEKRFIQLPAFKYRYQLSIPQTFNQQYYPINYPHYNNINMARREKIVYVSRKNEGASTFLFHITKKLQQKRIPTFYVKIQNEVYDDIDVLEALNVPSLKTLESVIQIWNSKATIPYLIIDGIEYLSNSHNFLNHLAYIFNTLDMNFIGNTQNKRALERIFSILPYEEVTVKEWKSPTYLSLLGISPPNTYFQKLPNNFKTLSQIQSSSSKEILMRSSLQNRDIINQLGISDTLRQIAGRQIPISTLKNMITSDQLNTAIEHGIFRVTNGKAYTDFGR